MDAAWVLSRNFDSLFDPRIAAGLGLDLALINTHVERMLQLGYRPVSCRASLTWALARLVLWRGDPDLRATTYDDLTRFGEEVRRYCARPETGFIRASHVKNARRDTPLEDLARQFEKATASPIERWLRLRLQTTDRAESVRHCRDSFRYFLRWLADTHPEIAALRQL